MADVPRWRLSGDWFDVCNCTIPCPCYFARAPTFGDCEGTLVWHIREGRYGEVVLDGLNVLGLGAFTGNIWSGQVKTALGVFFDQRADQAQRAALQMIFTGQAGGWPVQFAELVGDMRGVEFAPIEFQIAGDLGWWTARIPGKVHARGEALTGPTTLPGQRVQVHNPREPRSAPAGSPPREWRSPTRPRASDSAGTGRAGRASTSPSTGPGRKPHDRQHR